MKHCIIAKYTPQAYERRAELLPRIREIFAVAGEIPGVRGAEVYPNCVARENRYDVMIVLEMDRDALPLYDDSEMHHRWKDEFGGLLEKRPYLTMSEKTHPCGDVAACQKSPLGLF